MCVCGGGGDLKLNFSWPENDFLAVLESITIDTNSESPYQWSMVALKSRHDHAFQPHFWIDYRWYIRYIAMTWFSAQMPRDASWCFSQNVHRLGEPSRCACPLSLSVLIKHYGPVLTLILTLMGHKMSTWCLTSLQFKTFATIKLAKNTPHFNFVCKNKTFYGSGRSLTQSTLN